MILVTGVAGSGKSTQCQLLVDTGNYQWLSVGQMLRESTSEHVHDAVNRGVIIEDSITLPLVEAEILKRNDSPELLLDGFPRSAEQARWLLEKHRTGAPFQIRHIVHLVLSEQAAAERLHKRGRSDDYDKAIHKRFEVYEDVVLPIISQFTEVGIAIHEIDASPSEAIVLGQIVKAVQS